MRYIDKKHYEKLNQTARQIHSIRSRRTQSALQKKEKSSKLLITMGVILMLAALLMLFLNAWDNDRAGKAADTILRILEKEITDNQTREQQMSPDADDPGTIPSDADSLSPESSAILTVNGYDCIGILEIPSLKIRLPVLAEWDCTRLKTAPCLYSGSWQENNMVICGHNYRRHFAPIKRIPAGADVFFETVDGQIFHYVVNCRETISPTAVSSMTENQKEAGNSMQDWDLTLFTCNTGGRTRCAVRCSSILSDRSRPGR